MMIKKGVSVRTLVLAAVLAAISVILRSYLSFMVAGDSVRLGFGNIPIIFAGMTLGPVVGGAVGIVSDLLSIILFPRGAFHPGLTLSAALTGAIPGMVVLMMKDRRSLKTVAVACIAVYVAISLMLDTLWLTQLQGKAFFVLLPARAVAHGAMTVVNIIVLKILLRATENMTKT